MKFCIIILIFISVFAWGQSFESLVDFTLDLSSLNDPDVVSQALKSGKFAILEGVLGESLIRESNEVTDVWITLLGGDWIGTEEVRSYSCLIRFRGESWLDVFPNDRPLEASSVYIPPGSHLLIAVKIIGYDTEKNQALAEMVNFRVLD